jgi:hypothetical protein
MSFIRDALYGVIGSRARLTSHTFGPGSTISGKTFTIPEGKLLVYRGTIDIGHDLGDGGLVVVLAAKKHFQS